MHLLNNLDGLRILGKELCFGVERSRDHMQSLRTRPCWCFRKVKSNSCKCVAKIPLPKKDNSSCLSNDGLHVLLKIKQLIKGVWKIFTLKKLEIDNEYGYLHSVLFLDLLTLRLLYVLPTVLFLTFYLNHFNDPLLWIRSRNTITFTKRLHWLAWSNKSRLLGVDIQRRWVSFFCVFSWLLGFFQEGECWLLF